MKHGYLARLAPDGHPTVVAEDEPAHGWYAAACANGDVLVARQKWTDTTPTGMARLDAATMKEKWCTPFNTFKVPNPVLYPVDASLQNRPKEAIDGTIYVATSSGEWDASGIKRIWRATMIKLNRTARYSGK